MSRLKTVYGCNGARDFMKEKCGNAKFPFCKSFKKSCNAPYFLIPRDKAKVTKFEDGIILWIPKSGKIELTYVRLPKGK